jgi:hypothetical protein
LTRRCRIICSSLCWLLQCDTIGNVCASRYDHQEHIALLLYTIMWDCNDLHLLREST